MTSNIASQAIFELLRSPEAGEGKQEELRRRVTEALQASFKPEFLNRVDETVIFNALGREQLSQIVDLQLGHLRGLLGERKIEVELTARARELLFREGCDPAYGARPLKRALQPLIQDALALKILNGEVLPGDSRGCRPGQG